MQRGSVSIIKLAEILNIEGHHSALGSSTNCGGAASEIELSGIEWHAREAKQNARRLGTVDWEAKQNVQGADRFGFFGPYKMLKYATITIPLGKVVRVVSDG